MIPTPKQIEYFSPKEGVWKRSNTKDVFTLAVVNRLGASAEYQKHFYKKDGYLGINVCLVFDKEFTEQVYEDLCENFKNGTTPFKIYVFDENGVKIPVMIAEGNGWSENDAYQYGYFNSHGKWVSTACLFGYINPFEWKAERI